MISIAQLGKTKGAVNSIVVDRINGIVAEGMNGKDSILPENRQHPEITNRIKEMTKTNPEEMYTLYERDKETPQKEKSRTPHPDEPGRHAEVAAANRILNYIDNLRQTDRNVEKTNIKNLQIENRYTFKKPPEDKKCPLCANCNHILNDAHVPHAGRMTHHPNNPNLVPPKYELE